MGEDEEKKTRDDGADDAAIVVRGLGVARGGRAILRGVDLALPKSAIFGLIGANGAGKTTLVKAILDLNRERSGGIALFGRDADDPEARRPLAYLPERFRAPETFTGLEFLRSFLRLRGARLERAQAEEAVAALDLDPAALDRKIGSYSKGMTQKLGLASAFASGAPYLILDEPMSGLDPKARIAFKRRLSAHRAGGGGAFLCSHVLADIDEIADLCGVMHDGRLIFQGPPKALKQEGESLEEAFLRLIDAEPSADAA